MAPRWTEKWTLEAKLCLHKQGQGDELGNRDRGCMDWMGTNAELSYKRGF